MKNKSGNQDHGTCCIDGVAIIPFHIGYNPTNTCWHLVSVAVGKRTVSILSQVNWFFCGQRYSWATPPISNNGNIKLGSTQFPPLFQCNAVMQFQEATLCYLIYPFEAHLRVICCFLFAITSKLQYFICLAWQKKRSSIIFF